MLVYEGDVEKLLTFGVGYMHLRRLLFLVISIAGILDNVFHHSD